jgi:hypothetical protein
MDRALNDFAGNVYSQFGEDGIVAEILRRIEQNHSLNKWCVDVGAWDGIHLSNTRVLIRDKGYSAVAIEGSESRVKDLRANYPQKNVHTVCKFVQPSGEKSLDVILRASRCPKDFDFLSIDIDGMDYYIFESMREFRPKVVCIEFNPSVPNCVEFVQRSDASVQHGASAAALNRLAVEMGYTLVASTWCNLIFVLEELADWVVENRFSLEQLNLQGNDPQYIFVGYDGEILSNKDELHFPWHGISVPLAKMQFLPTTLRKFPDNQGFLFKSMLKFNLLFKMPSSVWQSLRRRLSL